MYLIGGPHELGQIDFQQLETDRIRKLATAPDQSLYIGKEILGLDPEEIIYGQLDILNRTAELGVPSLCLHAAIGEKNIPIQLLSGTKFGDYFDGNRGFARPVEQLTVQRMGDRWSLDVADRHVTCPFTVNKFIELVSIGINVHARRGQTPG